MEQEQIAKAVAAELERHRAIDTQTHRKHHEYIDVLIKREQRRSARIEYWLRGVVGWGLIAAATGLSIALWQYLAGNLQ